MAAEDPWQFWLNVMGNSDDDDEEAFEGFTQRELVKGEESDVDLDLVVQQDASRRFGNYDDDLVVQQDASRRFDNYDDDLVVQQDTSQRFDNYDDDDDSESGGEEEDADLPVAAGPIQAKRQERMSKQKRNELTTYSLVCSDEGNCAQLEVRRVA